MNNKTVRSELLVYWHNMAFICLTKGWALLIHLSRRNRGINKADAIQTGCVQFQFQERVEGYQEVFVSFETNQ